LKEIVLETKLSSSNYPSLRINIPVRITREFNLKYGEKVRVHIERIKEKT